MAKWVTKDIIKDLRVALGGKHRFTNAGQGGDVDTDNIFIKINKDDHISFRGFNPMALDATRDITTPSKCDVTHIEVTDGKDSQGGLNSFEMDTVRAYGIVRKYFNDKGFQVVVSLDAYY